MPALQVRECPPELYEELSAEAKRQNRSIAQQMLTILQGHYGLGPEARTGAGSVVPETRAERAARKKRLLEELDALPGFEIPSEFGDAATMVSHLREERW